jgi:hypothetical protein
MCVWSTNVKAYVNTGKKYVASQVQQNNSKEECKYITEFAKDISNKSKYGIKYTEITWSDLTKIQYYVIPKQSGTQNFISCLPVKQKIKQINYTKQE